MADVCDTDFSKTVGKVTKELEKYFERGNKEIRGKRTIVRDIVKRAKEQLKDIQELIKADPEGVDKDKIARAVVKIIDDTKLDYNTNVAAYQKMVTMAKNVSGDPARNLKGIISHNLNAIGELQKSSNREFQNAVDGAIANMKTGGKKVTEEQYRAAKNLFLEVVAEGDDALARFLGVKGVMTDSQGLIVKGLKQGHITDDVNIPELDLVFKAIKEVENEIQTVLEKKLPWYKRLERHAFVASFDTYKISNMTRKDFIANTYDDNGVFMFDLTSKRYKTLIGAEKAEYERQYLRKVYDSLTTKQARDVLERPSTIGGVFQDRNIKFSSEEAEALFFKRFGQDDNGLLKGRLNHLRKQLLDMNTRELVGSNPDLYFANLQNAAVEGFRGKVDAKKIAMLFESAHGDYQHAMGKYAVGGEVMSATHEISHNMVNANQTPLSGGRQFVYDGTIYSAVVDRSFDKKNGLLSKVGAHFRDMALYVAQYATNNNTITQLAKVFEDQHIAITMSRAEVIRRLHSPETSKFTAGHKGWLRNLVKFSRWNADFVSKYGLADATFFATRLKGAISTGQHIRKIKDFLDVDSAAFLQKYGFTNEQWAEIEPHLKNIRFMDKDVMYDTNHGFLDLPAELLKKYRIGIEDDIATIRRLNNQLRYMHQDTINQFAPTTSYKTGIPVHSDSKRPAYRYMHSLIFKYLNIHLTQNQGTVDAIKRINGIHNFDEGVWGSGIGNPINILKVGLKKENLMINMELLALIAAGGYSIEAMRALVDGKTPPGFTPHTIAKSLLNTGSLGFPGTLIQSATYKNDVLGTAAGKAVTVGKGVLRGTGKYATKGDPELLVRNLMRGVGIGLPASSLIFRHTQRSRVLDALLVRAI